MVTMYHSENHMITGRKTDGFMRKNSFYLILTALILCLLFCFPSFSLADDSVLGTTSDSITFYVTSEGGYSYIDLTSYKGLALCTRYYVGIFSYGNQYEEEDHGFYNVNIKGPSNWNYQWTPSATTGSSANQVRNETLKISFPSSGLYTITVNPIGPSNIQYTYWKEDALDKWINDAWWMVTGSSSCKVTRDMPIKYSGDEVIINYYLDGRLDSEETQTLYSSTYVYPKDIPGYLCTTEAQYISFDESRGCNPRMISFYYTKENHQEDTLESVEPRSGEGLVSINCYDNNDNWLEGFTQSIWSSQYVYPPTISGYTAVSSAEYISYNNGNCSPSYVHFYYIRNGGGSQSSGSRIVPTGWATQFNDQAKNLSKLDDDNSSTFFWWLIYKSNRTDSIPDLTAYFNNATISNISMRSGRPGQHYDYARVARFRVEIFHSGGLTVSYANFSDSASDNYQTVSLGGTYHGVSQINLCLDGGSGEGFYEGTGKGRYYIYIKDIKFGN